MVRMKMWEQAPASKGLCVARQIRVQRVILIQAGVRGFLVRRRMAKLRKKASLSFNQDLSSRYDTGALRTSCFSHEG